MPAKAVLEKKAWAWASKRSLDRISEEDLKTAYRINFPACKPGICRKNCSGNPNCFNHLQSFQAEQTDSEDNNVKLKGNYVGLKNLGSTCYVNSLLQVWFHNDRFCSVLFSYNAFPRVTSDCHPSSSSSDEPPAKKLRCNYVTAANTIQHLQLLFTRLCYSQQMYIDPIDFVNSLNLKHNEQQDAQEFRNLFLGWLENLLQKEITLESFIKNEFRGTCSYITTCSNCENSSTVQSDYGELELNIQGLKNINDSLTDFFKEETLSNENQYYCHQCHCKQDATRKIKLSSVPRVLNLQLLRFVYDMSLLAKVKVSSHILFPESLDLSQYGSQTNGETFKFHLTGVIIHRGPTAYSGHYIAHILDKRNGEWYRFDDEHVSKIDKKYLGEEDDEAMLGLSGKKKPRCPKGYHASANAYLLVYTRDDSDESIDKVEVPLQLREIVEEENSVFLESLQQSKAEMTANTLRSNEAHMEINSIFASLPANGNEEFEWMSTEWLIVWLTGIDPGSINNAQYMCEHKSLSPDSIVKLKRVNSKAVETLYTKYGDSSTIRLSQSMMCRQCVANKCRQLQLKQQIGNDYKRLCNLVKSSVDHNDGHWIGKKSFQCWRRLYHLSNNINEETDEASCDQHSKTDDSPTAIKSFNEDLLCPHGKLCADESKRRLLPSKAWAILLQYFPKAVLFAADASACSICLASLSDSMGELQINRQFAANQKEELTDLYLNKNRPLFDMASTEPQSEVYVVPMSFYEEWTAFIKAPTKCSAPSTLDVISLLCVHGGFLYDPCLVGSGNFENYGLIPAIMFVHEAMGFHQVETYYIFAERCCCVAVDGLLSILIRPYGTQSVVLLWPNEWHSLQQWYTNEDRQVCLLKVLMQDSIQYTSSPECCYECASLKLANDSAQAKDFGEAVIYIFKCETSDEAALKLLQSQKSKLQSRRHRVPVGSSKIKVSSTMTLMDLKLELMNQYAVVPNDQHLWLEDVELVDGDKMLMQLDITPHCIVVLKVDENKSGSLMDEFVKDMATNHMDVKESGFKGTRLIS